MGNKKKRKKLVKLHMVDWIVCLFSIFNIVRVYIKESSSTDDQIRTNTQ